MASNVEGCLIDGTPVFGAMKGEQYIKFNVDIEFDYLGVSDDKLLYYNAKYAQDNKSRQLIKAS